MSDQLNKAMREFVEDCIDRERAVFVAGAEFGAFHGTINYETMGLYPRELLIISTEAAKRYPKGGCDEPEHRLF